MEERIRALGAEIFALAHSAQPRVWQRAWWLEKATRMLDHDARLRARAFQFVDCLPALRKDAAITDHLRQYLGTSDLGLSRWLTFALGDGPLRAFREGLTARGTRFGATLMARRFITGFDIPSALETIERLRRAGMAFTLDVLGEFTTSDARAEAYAAVYEDLLERLPALAAQWPVIPRLDSEQVGPMSRINLSIKLTGLDPHFDAIDAEGAIDRVARRLRPLLRLAQRQRAFVNVDMESSKHRELTLDLFERVLLEDEFRDWTDVGIALQAYLRSGEQDLGRLLDWRRRRGARFAIRLVKGAYWDAEVAAAVRAYQSPAVWTRKWESDACYERMARTMLQHANQIRPAFASHNVRSLAAVMAMAERFGVTPQQYEVQMLYGMGDPLKTAMVRMGSCVRVYCPYGDLMPGMGYLIRRLLENTSNEGFLKQSYGDPGAHARLLADPARAQPASAPLPGRRYQNTDPEEPMSTFQNASNTNFAVAENRRKLAGAIEYVRGDFGRRYGGVISGQSVSSETMLDSHNPSNPREIVGKIASLSTADADRAVAAAVRAFPTWRTRGAASRADLLRKLADRLQARRFEFAATMILEVGKPWREADADVTEAIDHCRYYADQIERIESRPRLRNLPGEDNMLVYSPKGVCAVISPWSFPLAILAGMTTAALGAGNTVVMKPARQASVVAARFVDAIHDVGFPPGVVNLVTGEGATVGRHLVEHGDVNVVAFTGSQEVGTAVLRAAAVVRPNQPFIKKTIVEMGGKNAIIIDDDADLDGAVQATIESAFAFAGQKCSSCSRLIVLEGVYERFADRLREAVESVTVGPAEEPGTVVGPVIDRQAQQRLLEEIARTKMEANLVVEAKVPPRCAEGYFVPPTVVDDLSPASRLVQEETLGPIVAMYKARDFAHALTLANNTRYALTGGLFSRNPGHIALARSDFAVGNLYINRRITGSQVDAQPFGGFRLSGTGVKAGSPDYLLHFMDARCITENTSRSGFVPDAQTPRSSTAKVS